MNILYIGPYKDRSIYGLSSINHIKSIAKVCNSLSVKSISLTNNNTEKYRDSQIEEIEKIKYAPIKQYDAIVQYAPDNWLLPMRHITKKNYAIPIMEHNSLKSYNINKNTLLQDFNHILFDSQQDVLIARKKLSLTSNKIKSYSYISTNQVGANNFGYVFFDKQYKFYAFIDDTTINSAVTIIKAFLSLKNKLKYAALAIIGNNTSICKELQNKVNTIAEGRGVVYALNYIKVIHNNDNQYNEYSKFHSSMNCLIENKPETNTGINEHIAKLYNNSVINLEDSDELSLMDQMKQIMGVTSSARNGNNPPFLGDLLCK